jgi:hypothetical protein
MKRIKQIIRDKKTFILEIVCPILLTIIGCLVGYIEFLEENKTFPLHLNQITNETQIIYYNDNGEVPSVSNYIKYHEPSDDLSNIKFENVYFPNSYNYFDRYLINKIDYLYNLRKENNACGKFLKDFKISFNKRLKQIIREKKTFILEIICPILLTLIGCLVGYIEFLEENRAFPFRLNQITNDTQVIYYNDRNAPLSVFEYMRSHGASEDISNIKFEHVYFPYYISGSNNYLSDKIIELYNKKGQHNEKSYVYYDLFENSPSQHQYGFNLIIDIKSRQAAPIYANFLLNEVVHFATKNDNLKIEMINEPLPFTHEE